MVTSPKERGDTDHFFKTLSSLTQSQSLLESDPSDQQQVLQQLELAQAYCVNVSHADCEEIIGKVMMIFDNNNGVASNIALSIIRRLGLEMYSY